MFKQEIEVEVAEADSFMIEKGGNPDINDRSGEVCLRTVIDMAKLGMAVCKASEHITSFSEKFEERLPVIEARVDRVEYMVRRYLGMIEAAHGLDEDDRMENEMVIDRHDLRGKTSEVHIRGDATFEVAAGNHIRFAVEGLIPEFGGRVSGFDGSQPIIEVAAGTLSQMIRTCHHAAKPDMAKMLQEVEDRPRGRPVDLYRLPNQLPIQIRSVEK